MEETINNSREIADRLKSSGIVNFQVISHFILALFYTFCALLVLFTTIENSSGVIQVLTGPLILIYTIIIVTLVKSGRGFYEFDPNTRSLSFIGLIVATAHQLFVITYMQSSYLITISILYFVLLLEVILLFNLYFNRKVTLLLKYLHKLQNNTVEPLNSK